VEILVTQRAGENSLGAVQRIGIVILAAVVMIAVGLARPSESRAEEILLPGAAYSSQSSGVAPGSTWSPTREEEIYRIGPSDVLEISIWQSPDLNRTVTVRFDGRISFPLAGEIMASGLAPQELGAEIAERLREFIRAPQVTVTVKEFQSRQVLVLGKVGRAGIYPLRGPMKLLELLTAAGINLAEIDLKSITVMRATGEVLKIDLEALLYRQDIRQNIDLRSGDNIFVPEKASISVTGPQTKEIMVLGEVNKPGAYSFPTDRAVTVKEILLSSGGTTANASLQGAKVIRSDRIQEPTDLNRLLFNADMSQDLTLYAGDVVFVPKRKEMRVYVLGMVHTPGIYQGQPNTLDLLQILSLSVPQKFGAVLSNVKIVRGWPNNPKVISANVEALLFRGKLEENIPLQDGDVVYVPESFVSNVMEVLSRVLSPLSGAITFADTVQDVGNTND
jgi:polysaccharide export outer membrane protein